ncbi:conserved membrane hypothetical protein [Rhodococcus sp. RD6.2]|nr:conserved membrane hypothetical protein [Rhodococcus sp. RD6.2]
MLVVVVAVLGVPMPVMHVVDVVAVRNRDMPAAVAVVVLVGVVHDVFGRLALVDVVAVHAVEVAVVGIVDVVAVRHRHVAAARSVHVLVVGVRMMLGGGHGALLPFRGQAVRSRR